MRTVAVACYESYCAANGIEIGAHVHGLQLSDACFGHVISRCTYS
jgi:hypothetical protein